MEFGFDARTEELRHVLLEFMDELVYPNEGVFHEQLAALENHWAWTTVPVLAELREEARARGLWNLFLPGEHGAGLTNLQYAPLAEITGRSLGLAPPALNCSAPDTGNMELLASFKAAVILEGIHYRYVHGQTVGAGFEEIGALVEPVIASGLAAIKGEG